MGSSKVARSALGILVLELQMKVLTLALSGALALGALSASVPAAAQPRYDRWEHDGGRRHHHRAHPVRVCHSEWRHHHRVRICHTEMRRW